MYFDIWMLAAFCFFVGFVAWWNERKGFKRGARGGYDACMALLELQGIIKVKDGIAYKYDEKVEKSA